MLRVCIIAMFRFGSSHMEKLRVVVGPPRMTEIVLQSLQVHNRWRTVYVAGNAPTFALHLRFRSGEAMLIKMSSFPIMDNPSITLFI